MFFASVVIRQSNCFGFSFKDTRLKRKTSSKYNWIAVVATSLGMKKNVRLRKIVPNERFGVLSLSETDLSRKSKVFLFLSIPFPYTASSLCFAEKTIYTQEVLAVVLHQLMEMNPLPTLFMRTVSIIITSLCCVIYSFTDGRLW